MNGKLITFGMVQGRFLHYANDYKLFLFVVGFDQSVGRDLQ
jgi:hypothetical protein